MSKILKNQTAQDLFIADTGVTIPASGQYTIPPQDYALWAASSDVIVAIATVTVIVNDGGNDVGISDGVDIIKGWCPGSSGGSGSPTLPYKSGVLLPSLFTGSPLRAQILFATPYADNNYAILIEGFDNRNWTWENRLSTGFFVNSNASQALTGPVTWFAIRTT